MSTARILASTPIQQVFRLDLSNHNLQDDSADLKPHLTALVTEVPVGSRVEIDLADNYLNVEAAKCIAEWLKSGNAPRSTTIHLNANNMGDDAAKLLADASSSPNAPRKLTIGLGTNNITDVGASHWARVFSASNNQLELLLNSNKITEAGATILENAQKVARRSLTFDLQGNPLNVALRDENRKGQTQSVENFRHTHNHGL